MRGNQSHPILPSKAATLPRNESALNYTTQNNSQMDSSDIKNTLLNLIAQYHDEDLDRSSTSATNTGLVNVEIGYF
jgi:hypothetical protein